MGRREVLYRRLDAARAKGPHYFANRSRTADEIARRAYNSMAVEGETPSLERLREAAQRLIDEANANG